MYRGRSLDNCQFQSPLPTRGETWRVAMHLASRRISISSPHTGRDALLLFLGSGTCGFQSPLPTRGETLRGEWIELPASDISIPSPHTGRDGYFDFAAYGRDIFQSPLPTRGETLVTAASRKPPPDFNPLSPHGERPIPLRTKGFILQISIPSPHTGRDKPDQ